MKLTEVNLKTIDPSQAAQMLNDYQYDRQRNINRKYVAYYAHMMANGEWIEGTELAIAYAPNGDGKMHGHLVNGRHRLLAVIEAGLPIGFTTKTYVCEDDNEVAQIYGSTDTGKSRNIGDYLRALAIENEFGFPASDNIKFASAVNLILSQFNNRGKVEFTPGEQLVAMRRYADAASAYLETLAGSPSNTSQRKMRLSAVMGVGLVTLDEAVRVYGDDKVERFWTGVANNDGLKIGDPRKVAHDHLFEAIYHSSGSKGKFTSATYTARYIANCFNAWTEGREIKFTRVTDVSAPISIAGTHFKP